ncbi:hypothetical protein [Roseovarius sp. D22-M7]|uniref:hypothetical protein n=1 Tax=Roseovarius sp. D22-M7 TaxID=3127116 RepID=UPI00300FCBCF
MPAATFADNEGAKFWLSVMIRGFIVVQTYRPTRPEVTRELVEGWYRDRAHIKFLERIELCLGLFPDPEAFRPKGLIVRQTRQR